MSNRLLNSYQTYGWIAILLHWCSVPLVLFLLAEGMYMVTLTYYDPLYHTLPEWHKLAGVVLAAFTLLRVVWALLNKSPFLLTISRVQRVLAHSAHGMMYLLLLIMAATGYFITTAEGQSISLVAGISVPAIAAVSTEISTWLGIIHRWAAYALLGIIILHIAAALIHHWYYRDQTLTRMFKPLA